MHAEKQTERHTETETDKLITILFYPVVLLGLSAPGGRCNEMRPIGGGGARAPASRTASHPKGRGFAWGPNVKCHAVK